MTASVNLKDIPLYLNESRILAWDASRVLDRTGAEIATASWASDDPDTVVINTTAIEGQTVKALVTCLDTGCATVSVSVTLDDSQTINAYYRITVSVPTCPV